MSTSPKESNLIIKKHVDRAGKKCTAAGGDKGDKQLSNNQGLLKASFPSQEYPLFQTDISYLSNLLLYKRKRAL
jgi:hypothetical protein